MAQNNPKNGWRSFLKLCSKVESPEKFKEFFDLFLTIEERENLAARFFIIKALLEGDLTQREIAEKYKISIAQITRGSNALKIISPKLREELKTWIKQ